MKKIMLLVATLCLIYNTVLAENILMIGVDGADRRYINWQDNGYKVINTETISNTCTIPGWTQIFSGLMPNQSGAIDNQTWKALPYYKYLPGVLARNGYAVGWFVSKDYLGTKDMSPFYSILSKADAKAMFLPQDMGLYYHTALANKATSFMNATQEPWFCFIHFNPDLYGHGGNESEYMREISYAKAFFNVNKNRLNTLVLVVSDHGWNDDTTNGKFSTSHTLAPRSFTYTSLECQRFGTLRDVSKTILDHIGLDNPLGGSSLLKDE